MSEDLKDANQIDTDYGKLDGTLTFRYIKLPPFLIFHLKRFKYNPLTFEFDKISSKFTFPIKIDMSEHCKFTKEIQQDLNYSLSGIVMHSGTLDSGHYFVYLKWRIDGVIWWVEFNDGDV